MKPAAIIIVAIIVIVVIGKLTVAKVQQSITEESNLMKEPVNAAINRIKYLQEYL